MFAAGDSITEGSLASNAAGTTWVQLLAASLGLGYTNYGVSGATMLGVEELVPGVLRSSILAQMLRITPPPRYTVCVLICGTNDMILYGEDAPHLADFQAALQTGLLHLTSRRRIPEPKNDQERRLLREGKLPSVADGASVWVGNTPRQSAGHWAGLASDAAHTAYVNAVAATVAAVASQGRDVHLVDVSAAYDPDTMGIDPPSNIHPTDAGHAAIKAAFYSAMQAGGI